MQVAAYGQGISAMWHSQPCSSGSSRRSAVTSGLQFLARESRSTRVGAGIPVRIRQLELAGCTGLEPVASGVTGGLSGVAEPGNASQPLVISGTGAAEKRAVWQDFGGFRPPRVTPELQSPEVQGRPRPRFLSVREAAALLRVCTSTVYKLCAEGRLPHVRVSNAIRIPEGAIAACLHVE